jgi:predicted transcriptional regulator
MSSITVALPDDLMGKLEDLAKRHNVAPEDLVRASVEELVASPEDAFRDTLDYVLEKNKELYKRLAA